MEGLDKTDKAILRVLQENAKLTTKELADKVHLSSSPTFDRQKRLEREGYIKKYVALVDSRKWVTILLFGVIFGLNNIRTITSRSLWMPYRILRK